MSTDPASPQPVSVPPVVPAANPYAAPATALRPAPVASARTGAAPYASGRTLATIIIILMASQIFLALVADAITTGFASEMGEPGMGFAISMGLVGLALAGVGITTVVCWCLWVYRVVRNALALGKRSLEPGAGWTVGSFFVPVVCLFLPYQGLCQAWDRAHPKGTGRGLLLAWWLVWILSNLASYITLFASKFGEETQHTLFSGSPISAIDMLVSITAVVLATLVLRRISHGQDERMAAITGTTGAGSP
ncbi:MAG: hypothetical protein RLZZ127_2005 [Planctomycetota bacterium]|jgi:hypothetical protein